MPLSEDSGGQWASRSKEMPQFLQYRSVPPLSNKRLYPTAAARAFWVRGRLWLPLRVSREP